MSLLPIFVKLAGRLVVLVGGGVVGEQKTQSRLKAGARVRVIAPEVSETIAAWSEQHQLT